MQEERHEFGGPWTEVKLDALQAYSGFFTTALQRQKFDLWYIDAFAGTGSRTAKRQTGGLLECEPVGVVEETLDGSARRALAVSPPFQHLVFIDERPRHFRALKSLAGEHYDRDVAVEKGDANDVLPTILHSGKWVGSDAWRQRAVIFLDPYGINVSFETLRTIAATKRADVWYLVNLKGVVQQLAHDHSRLDESKRRSLTSFFGASDWEKQFYEFQDASVDLFNLPVAATGKRIITRDDVAAFYRSRLEDIFCYVSSPLSLTVRTHQDYFQFYCLSNNPSPAAIALIKKGAESVIRKHASAFRQTSGL